MPLMALSRTLSFVTPFLASCHADLDGVSLLQGLSVKGVARNDKKSVGALLETAGNLLKNGATEDVVEFARATLDEISGIVIPAIRDAHDADQLLIDQTYAQFATALAALEAGNSRILALYQERVALSTQHKSCRDVEAEKCEEKVTCDYDLWDLWKVFVEEERDLREIEASIDGHFCVQDEDGFYIANGTTWHFRDTSVPYMTSFISQKVRVDAAEVNYDGVVPVCERKWRILDDQTDVCDALQLNLERKACEHAETVREVQIAFAEAWNFALFTYNLTVHEVKLQEIDRISEYKTLSVVQCLLDRTSERNGRPCDESTDEITEEVTHCEQVRITTDVTWLYIDFKVVDCFPGDCQSQDQVIGRCYPQMPHHPCQSQYLHEEYSSLPAVPEPPFSEHNSHCNPRPSCESCTGIGDAPDLQQCTSFWALFTWEETFWSEQADTFLPRLCGDVCNDPTPTPPSPTPPTPPTPQCGALPELVNAAWLPESYGVLQYYCLDGYSFDGSPYCGTNLMVECLPNGEYSEVHPCLPIDDCQGHSCGPHGTCVDRHLGYECSCEAGFEVHTVDGEDVCGNIDDCEGTSCGEAGVCVDLVGSYECRCNDGWEQVTVGAVTTCERKECGDVPVVANVMLHNTIEGIFPWNRAKAVFGETVEYTCMPGYTTADGARSFSILCQADQTYTEVQECQPITCGVAEAAGGATAEHDRPVMFGEQVWYSCPEGFGPDGFHRECLPNGQLSPYIACEPMLCGPAPAFPMADLTNTHPMFMFGMTAEYRCHEGFSTDPADPSANTMSIACGAQGWEMDAFPICAPVSCTVTPDSTHLGEPFDIYYGNIGAILICAPGKTIDGTAEGSEFQHISCGHDGRASFESCMDVTCPADNLMISLNAQVTEHRAYTLGQRATYTCDTGYATASGGAATFEVECQRNGLFSAMSTCRNIDDCEGHSCGSNGLCVDGINEYSCNCESGFEETVNEVGEKVCGNIDDCGPNACGGHGLCHDLVNGFACECDHGYQLEGDVCEPVQCPFPDMPHQTTDGVGYLHFGDTWVVECTPGHHVSTGTASFVIECTADGSFTSGGSSTLPRCTPVSCGEPPNVGAETVDVRDHYFGESSASVCQGGEVTVVHECRADGFFHLTSDSHTCLNSCGVPALPAHAVRTGSGGDVVHPASADFQCLDGYTTAAGTQFSQTCRATGSFEALSVTCEPVVCNRPEPPANYEWANPGAAFTTQSPATLQCPQGHTGNSLTVTCHADGHSSFEATGEGCQPILYPLSGRIRNAMPPQSAIQHGEVMINGVVAHTSSTGNFNYNLPEGTHEYQIVADGFITITGQVTVGPSTPFLEISMSPNLNFDEWRIVLSWSDLPRDLDSHIQIPGCSEMYYARRSISCRGMSASLDVDDTNGHGPETTTLSGMTSYNGNAKIVYKVKHYTSYSRSSNQDGWNRSGAKVELYRGNEGLVGTFLVNDGHGFTSHNAIGRCSGQDCFWSLFSVDKHGNFEMCNDYNCN